MTMIIGAIDTHRLENLLNLYPFQRFFPQMTPSPVLLYEGQSRSTIGQHMLTKCSKNIFWVLRMSDLKYHGLTMSGTADMTI